MTRKNDGINDIIKVIKSLENCEEFYQKELLEKLLVKQEDFSIFLGH